MLYGLSEAGEWLVVEDPIIVALSGFERMEVGGGKSWWAKEWSCSY